MSSVALPLAASTFFADTWWITWREMRRLSRQRIRIVFTMAQPVIWLALMGNMFQRMAEVPDFPAHSYLDYMAPGIVLMTTLFGGMFGGMSIVWDRRFGYLEKMLAAPISRASIVVGKTLAVALQAAVQAMVIFGLSLAFGAQFAAGPLGVLMLLLLAVLICAVFAAFSLALASVLTRFETLMVVVNFLTMPLMFTSNAMVPTSFMPDWLAGLSRVNPVSYGVEPLRSLYITGWDAALLAQGSLVLALMAVALTVVATLLFRRSLA